MNEFTDNRTAKIDKTSCSKMASEMTSGSGIFQTLFCSLTNTLPTSLKFAAFALIGCLLAPGFLLGQAANLDQTRNGAAGSPVSPVNWVNGNAGETNAHFAEGYSIPYRMHITGLTAGTHELVIEWDTKDQNAHAIDFITYYDNLDYLPGSHMSNFGHPAEVVDPTDGITGLGAPSYFTIPAPSSVGAEVPGLPTASFNSLPANLKRFTIWNGTITSMTYLNQDPQDATTNSTKTSISIMFTTTNSEVLMAWGGHIAAEYDWGIGRGATDVSGSPYHTRLISIDGKGGNQDRSLKAPAVVIPEPDCVISGAQLACPETPFLEFNSTGSTTGTGVTYQWMLTNGTPSAGAMIDPATATSPVVKVIPSGSSFNAGGTFSLTLTVTRSTGQTTTCTKSPAGTIVNVTVAATANPTQIDLAFSTTSQLNTVLTGSTDTDPSHYTYSWTQNPAVGGSLSATNIQNPVFTATAAGSYTFEVTATQKAAPNCSNTAQVTIDVGASAPACGVSGPTPVCPGSTNNYVYDINGNGSANVIPPPYTVVWSLVNNTAGATFTTGTTNTNTVGVMAGTVCNSSFTVRITLTSPTGIETFCDQTVVVNDITPPVFTFCPPGGDLGCNPQGVPAPGAATATDDCGTPAITSALGSIVENGCMRTQVRTYTATDGCGNTSTCTQTFTWTVDVTPPVFTFCPPGGDLGCNPQGVPGPGAATATDACGTPTITSALGSIVENGCMRTQVRTYTATDGCGNTSTCAQTFTWTVDVTPPVFTFCPPGGDLGCNPQGVPGPGAATATDACGTPTITSALGSIVSNGCMRTQVRTYTATDGCGNTSTCAQTFTWTVDVTPPVFTFCPPGGDLGCNPQGVPAPGAATATDACGTPTITSALGSIVENGCMRTQVRTYTATDGCGNTSTCAQTFTWTVDVTPPVFTFCPPGGDLGCNPQGVPGPGAATATDACGTPTITSALGSIVSNGCMRTQVRTYTATDGCGNTSTCAQTFTWTVDVTPPVFTFCPPGGDLGCNPQGVPAPGAATATDACGTPTITSALGSIVSNGCMRTQVRTYTATDGCGNTSTCAQTFTWTVDVTPPVFTFCPPGGDLGCNPQGVPGPGAATATDACGAPTITSALGSIVENGCMRTQVRTYTATDGCGNTSTCTQTFTWTVDVTPPVFTFCPPGGDLGCNPQGVPGPGAATATDACGTPTITSALGSIVENGCMRTQVRTYTATDGCGNTSTCAQTFTWTVDVTPPVFTFCPPGGDLGCNPQGVPGPGAATATDACGTPTITSALGSIVSNGCMRTQVRTYTATDGCGNTSTCAQTFTWTVDVTPPVFTFCPPGGDLGCNPQGVPGPGAATATDACGTPTITSALGSIVENGCMRTQVRTYTATDGCGNTSTCAQTFTWTVDVTPPVFTFCPPGGDLGCNPQGVPGPGAATATDACGTPTITSALGSIVSNGCMRTQVRTYTATDGCGNTSTCAQTFTWTVDVTPPVFTFCPPGGDLGCNPQGVPAPGAATATDACGTPTITSALGSIVSNGCMRTQVRTYTATDGCGNTSTCAQTFTWIVDVTPPGFSSMPQDMDLECDAVVPDMPTITGTDNCTGAVTVTPSETDEAADCATGFMRIITRTWTAVDACNNQATHTQVIRIKCCPVICTYTQGYFGNDGGQACNGDDEAPNMFSTFETIQNSINAQGGTITIGKPAGKNVTVSSSAADVNKVIEILPGGGGSYAFTHVGSIGITAIPGSYLKKGRLNNTLFAQTLTLSINMGITEELADIPVYAGMYLVTAESVECGSMTVKDCVYEMVDGSWVLTYSPYQTYGTIPQALYDALATKTVSGLLALANNALGGDPLPAGVSLGMIADAVDMINNAFDECKVYKGWSETSDVSGMCTPPSAPPVTMSVKQNVEVTPSTEKLQVTAFPNPAHQDGSFNLRIRSTETGMATIEYFNVNGSKLSQSNKLLQANVTETVKFEAGSHINGAIMYKVTLNGKFARGIVMRLN